MRMTISKKLYFGIGVLAVVLIGLAVFFQANIKSTKASLTDVQAYPELQALLGSVTIDHFKWAEGLAVGTIMLGKEFKGQIDHTQCNLGKWYYGFKPPRELEDAFRKIEDPHKKFHATAPKIIALIKEKNVDAARRVYEEDTKPNLIATQEALTEMRLGVKKLIDRDIAGMKSGQDRMGMTSLIVYAVILGSFITGSALFLARPIKRGLGTVSDWVHTMSTGDLTKEAHIRTNDEIGDTASGLKDMVGKVKKVIAQTIEASNQVSVAADQIAEANQNFSQRITEQAASVEETSSTMEEMSASIRQTADNAREANKLSQAAKTSAESGIKAMGDTINAMDEINKSSSKIANISNVIEEIAFQTNLLALNAAVEAARAGEHGKGFAVVASEIRNLAQRASQSAKEITSLIEDSVDKTGKGVQLAQDLNKKLEEISIGVKKVADLMDEVAASAQEQASGINQVNTSVTQIDQMTQQNAALVEETSASAEELASQAKELMNLISFFKVDEAFAVEREAKGKGGSISPVKKTIQHLEPKRAAKASQPVLAHASAAPRRGVVSAEAEGKSNGGFEEF
ncbi:MAG: methyl-accepting chemotaxis protein [Nitrospirota bacterium]